MTVSPDDADLLMGVQAFGATADFTSGLDRNFAAARRRNPAAEDLLILSGGSQNGAFGAGFFAGMGSVPEYTVVTGVSTGALLSTLVFLANEPVPDDRSFPDYMPANQPSNVETIASLYSIDTEKRLLNVRSGGIGSAVVSGSFATFQPLRKLISGILSDKTLREIAEQYGRDRRLIVGVTNLNDGRAYAVDLTRFVADNLGRHPIEMIRQCYIDALLASSSVPPGMPPVTLVLRNPDDPALISEPELFIDGGARFGVFWDQLRGADLPSMRSATMVINGRLYGDRWAEFDEEGKKWSLKTVALRSVGILTNQIYRFSVDAVESHFKQHGKLNVAFISEKDLAKTYGPSDATVPPDKFKPAGSPNDCGEASKADERRESPMEFHAEHMRCLVAYGRSRAQKAPWNRVLKR